MVYVPKLVVECELKAEGFGDLCKVLYP